jgi:chromate transporter
VAERRVLTTFLAFLRLGLTSFGGPVAHLGYFRDEFVTRRKWLTDESYSDLVALCQVLPGPTSSQVGMALGLYRAGYAGLLAAWTGFTLPSAALLVAFAVGLSTFGDAVAPGVLHGLKVVAVAVVAQAVWGMARTLCPDAPRATLMAAAASVVLLVPSPLTQVAVIVLAALVGLLFLRPAAAYDRESAPLAIGRRAGASWLVAFVVLLVGLPVFSALTPGLIPDMIDAFYRAGSLVFGGGHVVLPLLQSEVVPQGWVDAETFLAGYGAAQAVPGPLFTFAAFLGASVVGISSPALGAVVALVAIFTPSFLLVAGALPFWEMLRAAPRSRAALAGTNAAVVGLLVAALYDPVWTSAIHAPADFALGVVALVALMFWRLPPWSVVGVCAVLGWILGTLT